MKTKNDSPAKSDEEHKSSECNCKDVVFYAVIAVTMLILVPFTYGTYITIEDLKNKEYYPPGYEWP